MLNCFSGVDGNDDRDVGGAVRGCIGVEFAVMEAGCGGALMGREVKPSAADTWVCRNRLSGAVVGLRCLRQLRMMTGLDTDTIMRSPRGGLAQASR